MILIFSTLLLVSAVNYGKAVKVAWSSGSLPLLVGFGRIRNKLFYEELANEMKVELIQQPILPWSCSKSLLGEFKEKPDMVFFSGLPHSCPHLIFTALEYLAEAHIRTVISIDTPELKPFLRARYVSDVTVISYRQNTRSEITSVIDLLSSDQAFFPELASSFSNYNRTSHMPFERSLFSSAVDAWRRDSQLGQSSLLSQIHAALLPGVVNESRLEHFSPSEYALLQSPENDILLSRFNDSWVIKASKSLYSPLTYFPATRDAPLFYMKIFSVGLTLANGQRLSTAAAFDVISKTNHGLITRNLNGLHRDGDLLEAHVAVAFLVASHQGSLAGSYFADFTLRLIAELSRSALPTGDHRWKSEYPFHDLANFLHFFRIPFLSPVNSPWPSVLTEQLSLANLYRPPNREMVDLVVEGNGIYVEMKNHEKPLGISKLATIISKLKDDAQVLFVVTNRFTSNMAGCQDWRKKVIEKKAISMEKLKTVNLGIVRKDGSSLTAELLENSKPVSAQNCQCLIIPIEDLYFSLVL